MKSYSDLEIRMKEYEKDFTSQRLMPLLPVCIRLDGRSFHTFTKGMNRPFDERMIYPMTRTTKFLVEETNACLGYTCSDEITLILNSDDYKSQVWFDGKIHKINSVLASLCSLKFNELCKLYLPEEYQEKYPVFDCRCWNVPNKIEACNVILWREQDATRNSVQSAGQANFSHKQMQDKSNDEIQEMLFKEKNINWNDYPSRFKKGVYLQKKTIRRKFTCEEIEKLPLKHEARKNPDLEIERHEVQEIDPPIFSKIVNKVSFVFDGADPLTEEQAALKLEVYR